jgi:hypothetical protein
MICVAGKTSSQFSPDWQMRQRIGCRAKPIRYPIPRMVQQMTYSNRMDEAAYTDCWKLPTAKPHTFFRIMAI